MKRSRLVVTGVAVLATLLFAGACVNKAPTPSASQNLKPAMQVLTEAADKTKGQSFKYTLVYGEVLTGSGTRDDKGNATRDVTVTTGANGLSIGAKIMNIIGDRIFAKLDLGSFGALVPGLANVGSRWMVVNPSKLPASSLSASLVPTSTSSTVDLFVSGVVTAENVSATEVKGTVDLAKAAPVALPASELAKLTAEQKIVAFTATLDGQGRIIRTVVNLPAVAGYPAAPLTTAYSDFASVITITVPPETESVDAPEAIYLLLP